MPVRAFLVERRAVHSADGFQINGLGAQSTGGGQSPKRTRGVLALLLFLSSEPTTSDRAILTVSMPLWSPTNRHV